MSNLRTAAQQALEALEYRDGDGADQWKADVITALRAALAQEQAEPVAWMQPRTVDGYLRPDLGYETCSKSDYGAFPVYRAPPKAEPAQKPAAVVGTQVDVWRGWDVRWAPPGGPIKTALMLKDMPVGTMLYTTPPQRKPLSGLEVERLLEQVIGSLSAARNLVRAVERAHGIIGSEIRGDKA